MPIYLSSSLGFKPVGVECSLCMRFQLSILLLWCYLNHTTNPPFMSRLGLVEFFGVRTKQKSLFQNSALAEV